MMETPKQDVPVTPVDADAASSCHVVSLTQWYYGIDTSGDKNNATTNTNNNTSTNTSTNNIKNNNDHSDNNDDKIKRRKRNLHFQQNQKQKEKQRQRLPLIDLRSQESFLKCHLTLRRTKYETSTTADFSVVKNTDEEKNNHDTDDDDDDDRIVQEAPVVHLPFDLLKSGERSCELPPRNLEFAIMVPSSLQQQQQKQQKNQQQKDKVTSDDDTDNDNDESIKHVIHDFFFATRSKATSQSRKPWLVKQIIYENDTMWKEANELDILYENVNDEHEHKHEHEHVNHRHLHRPLPRLWQPDQMVQSVLLPLLKRKLQSILTALVQIQDSNINNSNNNSNNCSRNSNNQITTSLSSPFVIWDLGSGAGRDVCYLAEELNYYYHIKIMKKKNLSNDINNNNNNTHSNLTMTVRATATPTSTSRSTKTSSHDPYMRSEQQQSTPLLKLCVVGIDNHKGSAKRCIPLWKYRHVSHVTESLLLNLNNIDLFRNELLKIVRNNNGINDDSKGNVNVNDDHLNDIENYIGKQNDMDMDIDKQGDEQNNEQDDEQNTNSNFINNHEHDGVVCLYAIRFLNRKLVRSIANCCFQNDDDNEKSNIIDNSTNNKYKCNVSKLILKRGTLFAMSHFCKSHVGASWNFDHPKEKSVLERHELRELFMNKNATDNDSGNVGHWEILHDEICSDGDHGRTLVNFVARRL